MVTERMKKVTPPLAALGALIIALVAVETGAQHVFTVGGTSQIQAAGEDSFVVEVTGSLGADWQPTDNDWVHANPEAFDIDADAQSGFGPGASRDFVLAARNASPELTGDIDMTVLNPEPENSALYDQLLYTVEHEGTVLLDAVPGADIAAFGPLSLGEYAPGEYTTVALTVTMPSDAGNELQQLSSRVQVAMNGVSR
ncbi:hypothetical protein GCM10009786_06100 [Leucobacter alluvii]|uniref:Ribosomally synthesized peptide with SipW-like signal peptide n=1 Tax=Leucobacter alluvii TaxID=340321 RepID=A0ABN3B2M4_9MICO